MQRPQQNKTTDAGSKAGDCPEQPAYKSWTRDKRILYTSSKLTNQSMSSKSPKHKLNKDEIHVPRQASCAHGHKSNEPNAATGGGSTNSTIIGHYELKRTLGKGNYSTVKLAQHRITQHTVAVKIIKTSVLSEDNLLKVNREIEVLKKLGKHNNIIRLYQVIKTKRYFMLVTEHCENGELYDYLVEKGKRSEPQSCHYFLQILSALEHLHEKCGIVHRDIKAENLLLTDNYQIIKIADFGFANYYKQDKLLSTWCGSPPYAAPELFKGLQYVGPPVDIWSLGVILYVLVCGSLPFDADNLVYLKSRVLSGKFRIPFFMSTECEGLIKGMLRLNPEKRFNSCQIRAHAWVKKHCVRTLKGHSSQELASSDARITDGIASKDYSIAVASVCSMDKEDDTGASGGGSTRGQSLDLDEDLAKNRGKPSAGDVSMLCLSRNVNSDKLTSVKGFKNLVDAEIVNAVSNMSLDSNNSAMSVSQGTETMVTSKSGKSCPKRVDPSSSDLVKESSIDDQIIDFMVGNLKVSDTQEQVRKAIASAKYDDIHAIYRLLKDQPKIMFETQVSDRFRIPALPLIPSNKLPSKKLSITTGFFHRTTTAANGSGTDEPKPKSNTGLMPTHHRLSVDSSTSGVGSFSTQTNAINLGPRRSDDLTRKDPPQLFLTPPIDSRAQFKECANDLRDDHRRASNSDCKPTLARHSFDSTMKFEELPSCSAGFPGNRLTLANSPKNLWDSSVLDTLGTSTPPPQGAIAAQQMPPILPNENIINQGDQVRYHDLQSTNATDIVNNLQQIGTQQNPMFLQLTNLTQTTATVTQSGFINHRTQEPQLPSTFLPNNLLNQNQTVLNNLTLQKPGIPNSALLDPNNLASGFERRASDGQASYSSLNTTPGTTESQSWNTAGPHNTSMVPSPLSSSSNPLSGTSCGYFSNTVANNRDNFFLCEMAPRVGESPTSHQENPLDLSTSSKDSTQVTDNPTLLTKQCSNSTSASTNLNYLPTSGSPRNSLFSSTTGHNGIPIPFCQISPSSLSLSGGGPGHLTNRRKRHSLENESKQQATCNQSTGGNPLISRYSPSRLTRRASQHHQFQYPANSHLGQLRKFTQTFVYKRLSNLESGSGAWKPAASTMCHTDTEQQPQNQSPLHYQPPMPNS